MCSEFYYRREALFLHLELLRKHRDSKIHTSHSYTSIYRSKYNVLDLGHLIGTPHYLLESGHFVPPSNTPLKVGAYISSAVCNK